jgi:hypothetical protein
MNDIWLTYSFTEKEIKSLCAVLRTRIKDAGNKGGAYGSASDALGEFEKTLNAALIKRISLEEAERLFNEN